jgi:aryl-alcohol dehydrogenase-like predicted oxidoreductase
VEPTERVVLGCGNFGGIGSEPAFFERGETEPEAVAIMDAAWALNLRWFDTADAYGGGRSEAWIGAWMRGTRNRPRLTTKTFNPVAAGADRGLGRERVLRQVETSLERLGLGRVDLYLAHEWDPETPVEETMGAFETLVERGLVGAYGLSQLSAPRLAAALESGQPTLLQNECSLLAQSDAEDEVRALCRERGVSYQAFSPLAGGWLTGKYRRGEPPPAGSRMTLRPGPYRHLDDPRVYAAIDRLAEAAAGRGTGPAALALAWALAAADSVVVGPRRPEHLELVGEALSLDLSSAEFEAVGFLFPRW